MPCQKPKSASKLNVLLLTALALSVTACATNLPPAAQICPTLPSPPLFSTPEPSRTFSDSAYENIKSWRKLLTDSTTTE